MLLGLSECDGSTISGSKSSRFHSNSYFLRNPDEFQLFWGHNEAEGAVLERVNRKKKKKVGRLTP